MYYSPLVTLLLISLANAQSQPEPICVQHRVVHPNLPITPWSQLGTIALPSLHSISPLGSLATLVPSDTLLDDLVQFAESVDPAVEGAMYQVALERGATDDVWPTSVVKAVSHNPRTPHPLMLISTSVTCLDRPRRTSPFISLLPAFRLPLITLSLQSLMMARAPFPTRASRILR